MLPSSDTAAHSDPLTIRAAADVPVVPANHGQSSTSAAQHSGDESILTGAAETVSTPAKSVSIDDVTLDRRTVWGVPFDSVTLPEAVDYIGGMIDRGTPSYVITANLNYVMLHHEDRSMHPITEAADLILADGQPIVARSRLDLHSLPERVAGSEMIYELAERAAARGWRIYFLGGVEGVAAACADQLQKRYPGLQVAGVESPPFRALTAEEQSAQDRRIRQSGAHLLLVAFGQPKGERWIHEHYKRLGVPVSIQLGASFDFVAGTAKRAPQIWQDLGLEWFYRMCSDPKRLVARYWENAKFLARVGGAEIRDRLLGRAS